jgi:ribonuclease HI
MSNPSPTLSNDTSTWLDQFMGRLAPPFVPNQNNIPSAPNICLPQSNDRMSDPFTLYELNGVLNSVRDSTPGKDGITYSFIAKCCESTKIFLLDILNHILSTGLVPEDWKHHLVIPILKPSKNPNDPSSYRPIALSSVLAKIMEHLIKIRLEWILESNGALSRSQFGFRKGIGTMDSLSVLTSDIRLALSRDQFLVAVFLDITAAYDNVLLPVLRQKMLQLSIPVRLVNVICNLYMGRSISVRINGAAHPPRIIWKGLPQGSVLSPILYSVYTSDLDKSVDSFCDILQYADDLALYYASEDISDCTVRLNAALKYLNTWLNNHGLTLSATKSSALVFTRKRLIPDVDLVIDSESLPVVSKAKFLGVLLDSRLSGIPHLTYIRDKCEKNINVLRALSGVWWGAHPYCQKLLYNAIVRSHLDYGSFLWEPCSKISLGMLDIIQTKCLRIVTGAMRSSPRNALQVECVDPPLRLRRQFLADRFYFKIIQFSEHPLLSRVCQLHNIIPTSKYWLHKETPCLVKSFDRLISGPSIFRFSTNPLFLAEYDALVFSPSIILNFGIDKHFPGANENFNLIMSKDWKDWLQVFTDASKLSEESNVGAAVWIPRYKIILNFKCPPATSIFTGEAIALFEAVSYIESHRISKTIILSDSRSCLEDLAKFPLRSKDNFPVSLKIREILYRCHRTGLQIVLAWIPSHSGVEGNEMADSCAREAADVGSGNYLSCFARDIRISAKPFLNARWQSMWNSSRLLKGRHYGNIQTDIPSKPWFSKYRLADKCATSTIIRLRLGHICSPVFLTKIKILDNSLCECGLEEGDVDHIFFNCPKQPVSLYELLPGNIARPLNISYLLAQINPLIFKMLSKYITKYKIKL